jgi:hypothetical protein
MSIRADCAGLAVQNGVPAHAYFCHAFHLACGGVPGEHLNPILTDALLGEICNLISERDWLNRLTERSRPSRHA